MGKRCIAAEIKATMDVAKIPVYLTFYAFIKCTTLQEKYDVSQIPSYTLLLYSINGQRTENLTGHPIQLKETKYT